MRFALGGADQGQPAAALCRVSCSTNPGDAGGAGRGLPRRSPRRHPRARTSRPRFISTGGTPNLSNLGRIRGTRTHRAGTFYLQRPDDARLRRGRARRLRPCCLYDGGQPCGTRAPGILDAGFQDADLRIGDSTGTALSADSLRTMDRRALRGTWLSRSLASSRSRQSRCRAGDSPTSLRQW